MESGFTHRNHEITVEYSSLDDALIVKINNGKKYTSFGDASSVDELVELIDDLIDTMILPDDYWHGPDHEQKIIDEEEALDPEEIAEIRQMISEVADNYDEENRPYMENRGYKAHINYLPDEQILEGLTDIPGCDPIRARSLKRLWHYFLIQVGEYLENASQNLPPLD